MANDNFLKTLRECCRKEPSEKHCLNPTQENPIILEDENSPEILINIDQPEKIHKIKLDGCFFEPSIGPKRCDWVLYCGNSGKIFFIELKNGRKSRNKSADKCAEQFISSVNHFQNKAMSCCVLISRKKPAQKIISKLARHGLKLNILPNRKQKKSYHASLTDLLDFFQKSHPSHP